MRFLFLLIFCVQSAFGSSFESQTNWDIDSRPSFRPKLYEPSVYLQPFEPQVDTSVGIPISTNDPQSFKKSLTEALNAKGPEALRNSKIYVLGVEMKNESRVQEEFQAIMNAEKFRSLNIQVIVLSVPPTVLKELSVEAARSVFDNLKYFFPSIKRDYQKPTWGEISSGLNANLLIEAPMIAFLFQNLPVADATMVSITHAALLGSYIIFQKSIGNWINRAGTSNREIFLKQSLMSLPFILNFNVFGNFSNILSFIKAHGYEAAALQIPHEIANFTTTQGFTLFLQTLFYTVIVSKGIRQWVNTQHGTENVRVARIMANYNAIPFLALDAVFLAMASTNQNVLMSLGAFDINMGHILLAALTAVGSALAVKPSLLDPTIRWYQSFERRKLRTCTSFFL